MKTKHLTKELGEAYVRGTLAEDEAELVEEHLLTCSVCYEEYHVDLAAERRLRAFAESHKELGKQVLAELRRPGLIVRLAQAGDAIKADLDEIRETIRRFVEGARVATLVPAVATLRSASATTLVIDQICRDFVVFSGSAQPSQFEFTSRIQLKVHYVQSENALRVELENLGGASVSKIAIVDSTTGVELYRIQSSSDGKSFDIPLDLLRKDVSISFQ